MSRYPLSLAVTLALCLTVTFADLKQNDYPEEVDFTARARQLVRDINSMTVQAKSGMYLDPLRQKVLELQTIASDLINSLPGEISESETQLTIKMAATGSGSHEILTVLLANDELSILDGRLSLSLDFLKHVAGQLEDELGLSSEIGPHLAAVVFGTNVTLDIIDTADKTVTAMAQRISHDSTNRIRRQIRTQFRLRRGWSVGTRGVEWNSRNGRYTFNARPTFSGLRPNGFKAFTIRF